MQKICPGLNGHLPSLEVKSSKRGHTTSLANFYRADHPSSLANFCWADHPSSLANFGWADHPSSLANFCKAGHHSSLANCCWAGHPSSRANFLFITLTVQEWPLPPRASFLHIKGALVKGRLNMSRIYGTKNSRRITSVNRLSNGSEAQNIRHSWKQSVCCNPREEKRSGSHSLWNEGHSVINLKAFRDTERPLTQQHTFSLGIMRNKE